MNSSVILDSETSVMSSSCLVISESNRSNGPVKLLSETAKPGAGDWASSRSLGGGATGDQLSRHLTVGVCRGMIGGKGRYRCPGDAGVREFDSATDHGLQDVVPEVFHDAFENFARVQ